MSKKVSTVTTELKELKNVFIKLCPSSAASLILVCALKKMDETGECAAKITLEDLNKIYENATKSITHIKKYMESINDVKMKSGGETIFSTARTHDRKAFIVTTNPKIDSLLLARGFKAFPDRIIEKKRRGRSKTLGIAVAAFFYALEHLEDLAKNGFLKIPLKFFVDVIGSSPDGTIKKAFSFDEDFSVIPNYCDASDRKEYLAKSYMTVIITGDMQKNLLAAFGMEPAVQKPEMLEIIPAIPEPAVEVEAQQLKFSNNEFENLTDEEFAMALEKMASALRSRHSRKVAQA